MYDIDGNIQLINDAVNATAQRIKEDDVQSAMGRNIAYYVAGLLGFPSDAPEVHSLVLMGSMMFQLGYVAHEDDWGSREW